MLIVGGGATGLGAAVDAASRGYRTALIERGDFAGATSSRSTKLIHGGLRYLRSGDVRLVREALHERSILLRNAPHLVHDRAFVLPAYSAIEAAYYAAGLTAYDLLAGRTELPRSRIVSAATALSLFPALRRKHLRAAIVFHDAQFDDARLAIALARTACARGAAVANYVRATGFAYGTDGRISGVTALEPESGAQFTVRAAAVVNATGVFADNLRALDNPSAQPLLALSRGSHVVVSGEKLLGAAAALLVPKTSDSRVLFAIPWYEHVLIGTTDVPVGAPTVDPRPSAAEITYILGTANRYLDTRLAEDDIRATFAGLRPLVKQGVLTTVALSRDYAIDVSASGLVTIVGGKWTTYRVMARDVIDVAARAAALTPAPSQTEFMPLHGANGSDASAIRRAIEADPSLGQRLDPRLPYTRAEVVLAVRDEMARTVEDVLARRTRALVLDVAAARACASTVAALMAAELGRGAAWADREIVMLRRGEPPTSPP